MTPGTESRTVLLVDDSPRVRPLVREILGEGGFRVLEADGPKTALDIAAAHSDPIDLVLTDMMMPGMTGLELVDALRKTRPNLKVLCMSGYSLVPVAGEGIHFIEKPFRPDALMAKVRAVLDSEASAADNTR